MSRVSEDLVVAWCGPLPKSLKSNLIMSRLTLQMIPVMPVYELC
jgi:hypothetical protein